MKMPLANRYDFIDGVETGQRQATPELNQAAQAMRTMLDEARDRVQALGTGKLDTFIQDYFPHIWKDPNAAAKVFGAGGKRPLEGSKAFLKQRTIPTTRDGLAAGLEPVTDNPVELVLLKLHEINRYVMGQETLAEGKDKNFIQLVKTGQKPPDDWVKINDKIGTVRAMRKSFKADGTPAAPALITVGEYYAHPDAGRILNNYLSPGLMGNALYDAARYGSNMLNMAQLGLSAFHLTAEIANAIISRQALGLEQLAQGKPIEALRSTLSAWTSPITSLIQGNKVLKEALKPGTQGGDLAQIVDALQASGFRLRQGQVYRLGKEATSAWDAFVNAAKEGRPSAIPKLMTAALEQASRPIMEWFVPRMKLGIAADLARSELSKLPPGASRDQMREVMGKVWDSVDNRLGQLVYDNLFWHKTLKDSLMLSTRSLGWNLGTFRELGGGAYDLAKAGKDVVQGYKPELSHRAAYALALPIQTAIVGAIATYLFTGHGPQQLIDYIFPPTGEKDPDGSEHRIQFPTYMKDVLSFYKHPGQTITNKASPIISSMLQMYQNRDYYGNQIRNADDPLVAQAQQTAEYLLKQFIPFAARGAMEQRQRGESLGTQAASFFGITPAPKGLTESRMESYIHEQRAGMQMPPRTPDEAAKHDAKAQVKQLLEQGQALPDELKKKVAPKVIAEIRKKVRTNRLDGEIKSLSFTKAMHAADMATDEEWAVIKPILVKRYESERKKLASGLITRDEFQKAKKLWDDLKTSRGEKKAL